MTFEELAVSLYLKDVAYEEAIPIRCPEPENTPESNMLPVLIHLPSFEKTYNELICRGFTHEEAVTQLSALNIYIREEERYRTKIVGLSSFISHWLCNFTKCRILYLSGAGLNFHRQVANSNFPYILKNKISGEYVPVFANNYPVHKSGIPLGSAGATDSDGAFYTTFTETEEAYIGHTSDLRCVSKTKETFKKSEWEIVVAPGDEVIAIHIFWDANLRPEAVQKALNMGQKNG